MAAPRPAEPSKRGRVLSFNSGKSEQTHRSSGSGPKVSLSESHDEKAARQLHTKADPTLAMNEMQPAMVALEKSNLESLRGVQYKDQFGNPITEPDISNPTRPRFERPLDTIRSFEAAVEGSYNSRRMSYARTDDGSQGGLSRRGSYFGGLNGGNAYNNRYSEQGGNYWGRPNASRPDSFVDNYGGSGPNQPYNPHYPFNNNPGGRPRPRYNERMNSESAAYGNNAPNIYTQHGYQKSYDNMTAVNSSLDRLQQQQQQRIDEKGVPDTYGFNGFGPAPQDLQVSPTTTRQIPAGAPIPPPHAAGNGFPAGTASGNGYEKVASGSPLVDPNMGGPVGGPVSGPSPANTAIAAGSRLKKNTSSATADKRKSWFKRRFSKDKD